jgi:hypothetical protein
MSVSKAIWSAVDRIAAEIPELARHFRAIRTGTRCSYTPDPRAAVSWRL